MKPLAQNTLIQNRYLIVHLIGKGGMGEVYLAVDQRLGSAVALKRTFFAGDDMLGNAFEREARTLARMRHPVLPKVSDHFGEGDEQYLVMEHISGDDLSKRLEAAGKPFPISWVLFWADQLLDALSYLHTHEPPIIHRDIKPQNLKLTDENHIILLDFGLSKTSTGQTNISQSGSTGSVVGYTPHYAPMEQIRGIGTSPRSDLYSLSATLYQLLTNSVPVDALTRADAMLNGLPDPIVPPHELNPEVPQVVSEVLLRAMEVSQEKRFANAREMQRVLRKAFNEIQQATTANTVAFNVDQAGTVGMVAPGTAPDAGVKIEHPGSASGTGSSAPGQDARSVPPGEANQAPNFDATIAYDSPDSNSGGLRQSDVKTEVFIAGSHSLPIPGSESFEPPASNAQAFNSDAGGGATPDPAHSTPGAYPVDATAAYIPVDRSEIPDLGPAAGESETPQEPPLFGEDEEPRVEEAEVPYFRSAESEPEAAPYAASAQVAVQPAKKSSSKTIILIGGMAAVLLLAAAVGGGIWAYMTYGPGAEVEPTPTPSPEETATPTPEPTPTVDDSNSNLDVGNSDVNNSLPTNGSSNSDLTAPPTPPEREPERDPTPGGGGRPTPTPPRTERTPRPTPSPRKVTPTPPKIRVI